MTNRYTAQEDDVLRVWWRDKKSMTAIAKHLGRARSSVEHRLKVLGLRTQTRPYSSSSAKLAIEGRRMPDHIDPMRALLGDPPPGMSALDKRQ